MSAQPWPHLADPRRTVRVGQARVRVAEQAGNHAAPSALIWQQRIEDALRCAHFGAGQRLVLLRKLQVKAASTSGVLSPGWAGVVEAAAQDAVARARNGRSAGAEQAGAVWFESWDDAVAAWLDAALGWPGQSVSPHAWFWSRIARMAGLPTYAAAVASTVAPSSTPAVAAGSRVTEQAQAMLVRWQADPASQRACSEWLAQRPALQALLMPPETAAAACTEVVADTESTKGADVASGPARVRADDGGAQPAGLQGDALTTARTEAMPPKMEPTSSERQQDGAVDSSDQAASALAAASAAPNRAHDDSHAPHARAEEAVASRRADLHGGDATVPAASQPGSHSVTAHASIATGADDASAGPHDSAQVLATTSRAPAPVEPFEPAFSALGWTHLRPTQLGGLPLTINALQRLGFANELDAVASSLDQADRLIAASAPWLALWAGLAPAARQRWVRDPMFAVLPAFDAVADLPVHARADALLARWQAQPPAVRQLGRRMWRRLQGAAQASGWRSPRLLLQRPAWMQLSATHLDVIFALDQADLAVRRLGLDADPGWVPWLGRIVSLHFEPANELPTWSTP